jgi:hypothetical protein
VNFGEADLQLLSPDRDLMKEVRDEGRRVQVLPNRYAGEAFVHSAARRLPFSLAFLSLRGGLGSKRIRSMGLAYSDRQFEQRWSASALCNASLGQITPESHTFVQPSRE